MIANKILVSGLALYLLTILFSTYQLPGTLELAIFSIPTVSLLLFRYHRIHLKGEKNVFMKFFSLMMSIFISISLMIPILTIKNNTLLNINQFLLMSWVMLISLNMIYYSYYLFYTRRKSYKMGYFIIVLSCIVFLLGTCISYYFSNEYTELKYITFFSLSLLSLYLFYQFAMKKTMPHIELGGSLLLGGVFMYMVDLVLLLVA